MAERKKKHRHGLSSDILSFGELLSGAMYFIMPILQRPYEWSTAEVSAMLDDMLAASDADYQSYAMGQIIGVRGPNKVIELVDGQQRAVTAIITLAYLRDRLAGRNAAFDADIQACIIAEGRARVTPRPADASFLRDFFQARDSGQRLAAALAAPLTKEDKLRENDPQPLMLNAARVVRATFDRLAMEPLQKFADFFLDRGIVNFVIADDRSQAAILYRSHNITGRRRLSTADLLKVEAIENSDLSAALKEKVARTWEQTEDDIGRALFAELLEMLPLLVAREPTKQPGDINEWRAKSFKGVRAETLLLTLLPLYAELMTELLSGEIVADCRTDEDRRALEEANALLKGLLFLRERHWIAPAINFLYVQRENPKSLLRFFRGLDRLCYACFMGKVEDHQRRRRFALIVAAGVDDTLLSAALELAPEERHAMAKRLREPFERDPWRRRAIATRANAALPNGRNFSQHEDVTVEHVLPAKFTTAWAEQGWTKETADAASELLGNFVLLTEAQNGKAGRNRMAIKKDIYFNTEGAPVHALTEDIRSTAGWTEADVHARTDRLARLLITYWKLEEK